MSDSRAGTGSVGLQSQNPLQEGWACSECCCQGRAQLTELERGRIFPTSAKAMELALDFFS